jgi:hypothetical protein
MNEWSYKWLNVYVYILKHLWDLWSIQCTRAPKWYCSLYWQINTEFRHQLSSSIRFCINYCFISICFFLFKLGDFLILYINSINYGLLSKLGIIFTSLLVIIFALIENVNILYVLLVFITSISLGMIPHYTGVNKSNLMGVLIIPAIIIYASMA